MIPSRPLTKAEFDSLLYFEQVLYLSGVHLVIRASGEVKAIPIYPQIWLGDEDMWGVRSQGAQRYPDDPKDRIFPENLTERELQGYLLLESEQPALEIEA